MSKFSIILVDDHDVVRQGIRTVLKPFSEWDICAEASNGREALQLSEQLKPDLIIMDISMPKLNGLDATNQIIRMGLGIQVLILSMHDSVEIACAVMASGAKGFVLKSNAGNELVSAVRALQLNGTYFSTECGTMVMNEYLNHRTESVMDNEPVLTLREREVLQLLAEGHGNREVASVLGLSVKTVETHRSNINHKLQLHSITDLVLYAIRHHIVQMLPVPRQKMDNAKLDNGPC